MSSNIKLKKATPMEVEELVNLRMRAMEEEGVISWHNEKEHLQLILDYKEYYRQSFAIGDHEAVLGYVKGVSEPVALGGVTYYSVMPEDENPKGEKAYIVNMYTLPLYRRMGLGKAILEHLIGYCKKKGIYCIALESSEMAKQLYIQLGFVEQAAELIYKGN